MSRARPAGGGPGPSLSPRNPLWTGPEKTRDPEKASDPRYDNLTRPQCLLLAGLAPHRVAGMTRSRDVTRGVDLGAALEAT
jgi:hypothetical protein